MAEEPMFRASKRRKVLRKRPEDDDDDDDDNDDGDNRIVTGTPTPSAQSLPPTPSHDDDEPTIASAADILRRRKLANARKGGVGFSSSESQRPSNAPSNSSETALVPVKPEQTAVDLTAKRFTAPTGKVMTEDKHMMAYIDAKMSGNLRSSSTPQPVQSGPPASSTAPVSKPAHSATHGQLQEIDLGPSSTLRNIAATEAAYRRLESGQPATDTSATAPTRKPRPPRLGRDGKPLPPRRNRGPQRTEDDFARDALVEQIMRESQLNMYDSVPARTSVANGAPPGADEAADERLADEFRREYLAAMEEKNASKKPPGPPGLASREKDGTLKGPKLGGSRSQRAAMRAAEEAAAKGKKR